VELTDHTTIPAGHIGPARANGRQCYRTRSGLMIGLRAPQRPPEQGSHAEAIQALLLHPSPLRVDEARVLMDCLDGLDSRLMSC